MAYSSVFCLRIPQQKKKLFPHRCKNVPSPPPSFANLLRWRPILPPTFVVCLAAVAAAAADTGLSVFLLLICAYAVSCQFSSYSQFVTTSVQKNVTFGQESRTFLFIFDKRTKSVLTTSWKLSMHNCANVRLKRPRLKRGQDFLRTRAV